ncbi:MAG: hypothetical protein HZA54_09300 [Planctomycetes bacterium]|nr:hypothetical protein [Planctomycetota bacterium]
MRHRIGQAAPAASPVEETDVCVTAMTAVSANEVGRPGGGAGALDSRCAWWCLLLTGGFAYVALALCGRSDPFLSGNRTHRDFLLVLLLAPVFYYLAPRNNLPRRVGTAPRTYALRVGLGYVLPFFLGLHFKHLGEFLGLSFSLTESDLRALPPPAQRALAGAGVGLCALLAYHLALARREAILLRYVAGLVGTIAAFGLVTWALRGTHYAHVHHYMWGAFLVPVCRFKPWPSLVGQAAFLGVAIEGVSRWGMDPWWYPR